ncbi:hypothetical protein KM043_016389 [Ampulex compressa]|nr:hypothetical protein KM043_016389 [Ampulex compressa]
MNRIEECTAERRTTALGANSPGTGGPKSPGRQSSSYKARRIAWPKKVTLTREDARKKKMQERDGPALPRVEPCIEPRTNFANDGIKIAPDSPAKYPGPEGRCLSSLAKIAYSFPDSSKGQISGGISLSSSPPPSPYSTLAIIMLGPSGLSFAHLQTQLANGVKIIGAAGGKAGHGSREEREKIAGTKTRVARDAFPVNSDCPHFHWIQVANTTCKNSRVIERVPGPVKPRGKTMSKKRPKPRMKFERVFPVEDRTSLPCTITTPAKGAPGALWIVAEDTRVHKSEHPVRFFPAKEDDF